jgi:hypothetical protein
MELLRSNREASAEGSEPLPGVSNYFLGNDPSQWRTNVPTYARVRYGAVYPGIDLVYYGNHRQLEYDFVVAPGADPKSIRVRFTGQRNLSLAKNGDLVLHGTSGRAILRQPVVYQEKDGRRQTIPARFELAGGDSVRFHIGQYDRKRPLVIDPVLTYATYLGGSGGDYGNAIAVDSKGSAYVVGATSSLNFPVTSGVYEPENKAEIAGGGETVFVSKFNATGTALVYSTYLGGSGNVSVGAGESGLALAVDAEDNAYIAGGTFSSDFPVTPGAYQTMNGETGYNGGTGFVTKLNPSGSALVYSTYLGGSNGSNAFGFSDEVLALAVDSAGDAYLTGNTHASNFPVTPGTVQQQYNGQLGAINAFVTKLNPTGTKLLYSTYLGGSGDSVGAVNNPGDSGQAIAVDASGDAYISGITTSVDFPTTSGAFQTINLGADCLHSQVAGCGGSNAFVTRLNPTATKLLYSTYLGGIGGGPDSDVNATDGANAIAIDSSGDAFVAGLTNSLDFPVTAGSLDPTGDGNGAGFVAKLNPAGSALVYSTFFGNSDAGVVSLAVDSAGKVYLAGYAPAGITSTADAIPSQSCCAYLAKLNTAATALEYATYLGGTPVGSTVSQALALDASGNVYLTGTTRSLKFPVTSGAFQSTDKGQNNQPNAFVAKFALAGETTDHFGTVTTIADSGATSQSGKPETITATVAATTGGAPPTGSVTFSEQYYAPNSTARPTPLPPVTVALNASGQAIWTPSISTPGGYIVSAAYNGDDAHFGSQSGSVNFAFLGPPAIFTFTAQQYGGSSVYGNPGDYLGCAAMLTDSAGDPLSGIPITVSGAGLAFSPSSAVTSQGGYVYVIATPLHVGSFTFSLSAGGTTTPLTCDTVTATPAPLTVAVRNEYKIYGAALPTLLYSVSGLVGSDTVNVVTQTSATASSAVGTYPITGTVSGADTANYSITVGNGTLTVSKATLDISAKNVAVTYGQTPPPVTAYALTGFVNGDTASVVSGAPLLTTSVTSTTPVGFYPIGVQVGTLAAENYSFSTASSGEGSVGVYRAPLTIKPASFTIHVGDPLPTFTYAITGFVNGDTQATATTGAPTLSTTAPNTNTPGHYDIVAEPGTLAAKNYSFNQPTTATDGILTILAN